MNELKMIKINPDEYLLQFTDLQITELISWRNVKIAIFVTS